MRAIFFLLADTFLPLARPFFTWRDFFFSPEFIELAELIMTEEGLRMPENAKEVDSCERDREINVASHL